jgi:hypothetical protein
VAIRRGTSVRCGKTFASYSPLADDRGHPDDLRYVRPVKPR